MPMQVMFFFALVSVSTIALLCAAANDLRIFVKGGFDEQTNPCDVPVDQLEGLAKNVKFIRTVAGVRLIFGLICLVGLVCHLI
jgi:hypothetical protein